ncbi:MAG: TetR/AcrR family transcriptional regulator [Treponemataceae bacterium]
MKGNTREKIIKATLSLYTESAINDVSISSIAKNVGITKAGIYKHFSSKADLLHCVEEYFFDQLYICCSQFTFLTNDNKDTLQKIFTFFLDQQELLCYAVYRLCLSEQFEKDIFFALKKRGLSLIVGDNDYSMYLHDEFFRKKYLQFLYNFFTSSTLLLTSRKSLNNVDSDILCNRVIDFVLHGWWMLTDILPSRRIELQEMATIDSLEIPEHNKVYEALATLVEKEGFSGVTIELLAKELGLAKSSLYSYFTKKNNAIINLVVQEIKLLAQLLYKRLSKLDNLSERIYVHIFTVFSYLQKHSSVTHICGLIRTMGLKLWDAFEEEEGLKKNTKKIESLYNDISIPDFGYKLSIESFTLLITMLPICILIHGKFHHFSVADLKKNIDFTYDTMRKGIKN